MDLKVYYQKIRQVEASIEEPHVVVISHETADGGRAGVVTEAPRRVAARLVLEGKARLATAEEAAAFREQTADAKRLAEQAAAANRVQVTLVSEAELRALKNSLRAKG